MYPMLVYTKGKNRQGLSLRERIVYIRGNLTNPGSAKEVSMDQFQA